MAAYAISDIHDEYDKFLELLAKIDLKKTDTLYVLGDVLDRGSHPIKMFRKLMEMPNTICMVGSHEVMALECFTFLMKEITDLSLEELDEKMLDNLVTWQYNDAKTTIDEFRKLSSGEKQDVVDFIRELLIYEEVTAGEKIILGMSNVFRYMWMILNLLCGKEVSPGFTQQRKIVCLMK